MCVSPDFARFGRAPRSAPALLVDSAIMALHDGNAAVDLDATFLDDDDVIEAPPSTKRLDRRDILAAVAAAEHIEDDRDPYDDGSTLMVSPEENRRLLASAFAGADAEEDGPRSEDITLELKAPIVPLPDWIIEEQLQAVDSMLVESPRAGRPWLGEAHALRAIAAAWTVALATAAFATYVLAFAAF